MLRGTDEFPQLPFLSCCRLGFSPPFYNRINWNEYTLAFQLPLFIACCINQDSDLVHPSRDSPEITWNCFLLDYFMSLSCFQQGNFPSFFLKNQNKWFSILSLGDLFNRHFSLPSPQPELLLWLCTEEPWSRSVKAIHKSSVGQVQLRKVQFRMVPLFPSCPLGVEKRFKEFTVLHSKELKFKTAAKHTEDNTRT